MKKEFFNNKIFIIAVVLIISTVLWSPVSVIDTNTTKIGLPLRFIWYHDYTGLPMNRLRIFEINNLLKIDFRVINFLVDILIVYFLILMVRKYTAIIKKMFHNN